MGAFLEHQLYSSPVLGSGADSVRPSGDVVGDSGGLVGTCDVVGENEGHVTHQPGFEAGSHFLVG